MTRRAASSQLAIPTGSADHAVEPASAVVTLVEYGDYECPSCGQAYPIVKELVNRLAQELRFVFRNFPLSTVHRHAEQAAKSAEAAAAQGRFWEMHDILFESQEALDGEDLIRYAATLGLDESQFIADLSRHIYAARVREDFMGGVRSGANGTPTFFINGGRYDGPFDFDSLLEAIENEIADVADRS
jgi:protein-disulfide isomerase